MNPNKNKDRIEHLLTQVAPILKNFDQREIPVPPRVLQALQAVRERKFPTLKEITVKQMETLLLKILAEKPMAGFELASSLEKARIKLKNAGEGELYGLLSSLETGKCLQTEEKERGGRMVKIYRLTEHGRGLLEKSESNVSELNNWSKAVFAVDPSTA